MKKEKLKQFFIFYLIFYFIFLVFHAFSEISLILFFGIGVAILAHTRKSLISLILLFVHMSIEWFEWGLQIFVLGIFLLNVLHAIMDFTFLNHEIKIHFRKINSFLFISPILIVLVFLYNFSSYTRVDLDMLETLHSFVLGGVIGCVGSHLVFHFTKEKQIKKSDI